MKSTISVPRLKKSGNYMSSLDREEAFKSKTNPEGLFKVVVQPIPEADGNTIHFWKAEDGSVLVDGEGYIITGYSEADIDRKCKRYMSEKSGKVINKPNPKLASL